MTTVADILNFIEGIAPTYMKMDWDNCGLLCGRKNKEVHTAVTCLVNTLLEVFLPQRMLVLFDIRLNALKLVFERTALDINLVVILCVHTLCAVNTVTS